ncbi:sn-glycerol-3-phosphate ABC transporter ATP-binding protein UgpC [Lichenibacterium minor]|uniref:sn-glycerol-3-phosphate ABC transporter ATP-binding protein UgpC n=1 Tax=Lichenibacterium minor TaxID=2316528 RepID=A0A4Q2U7R7_9HYPH|nr:sn-glycerol-3-phosphate ABC transporter ATP-binding protein UgpC [Lichenibacterium minor]RYC31161.1 sn-glycerol-3-phosphate ABC transporter ATP-binding protein UgpC [Lichenibacterium minor]
MATVTLKDVRKSYGAVNIIQGVDLAIQDREFVVFVGPSGCGKSTLLRMIAGLEEITSGDLMIDGAVVNDVPPDARGLAMVFQSYALYPHMTVADNMAFALRLANVPKAERDAKVMGAAKILQLEKLLDRRPGQLSGGQRQRVAIGRAIVRQPKVFLFDEPLSNLDASLRVQMRIEIARLHAELNATMIYVTHDQIEAMTMADRIVVLRAGRIEQVGSPLELYHYPANTFVAGFIGSPKMNLTPATVKASHANGVDVVLPGGGVASIPVEPRNATPGAACTVGFRPESLSIGAEGPLGGKVAVVEHLGGETLVYVDVGDGHLVTVKAAGSTSARIGDVVRLAVNTEEARLFDKDGMAMTPMHRRAIAGMSVAAQ